MSQAVEMSEIVGGAIWLASAVAVAGYTWQAMTGEYEQFPSLGGGGGGATPPKNVQKSDAAIGLPNLTRGRKAGPFSAAQTTIAGVAASPITAQTVVPGGQGTIATVGGWAINAGKTATHAIGQAVSALLP